MGSRTYSYRKLQALEDERKLGELDAMSKNFEDSHWDPTSEIPGTGPEKTVYNYLYKMGVRFTFQYHYMNIESTAYPEDLWIPDFNLTDYNIIIEVFGTYWHSLPSRRTADILKAAYHLINGYTVVEYGVPTIPSNGYSVGKVIYWWDTEIAADIDGIFTRDIPEVSAKWIPGTPQTYLLDATEQRQRQEAQSARMIKSRMRPKISPFEREQRAMTRKLFDLSKTYPILRQVDEYAEPKVPKRLYRGRPRTS